MYACIHAYIHTDTVTILQSMWGSLRLIPTSNDNSNFACDLGHRRITMCIGISLQGQSWGCVEHWTIPTS